MCSSFAIMFNLSNLSICVLYYFLLYLSIDRLTNMTFVSIIEITMKNKDFLPDSKIKFILWFAGIFLGTFLLLFATGLVPDELTDTNESVLNDLRLRTFETAEGIKDTPPVIKVVGEAPVRLSIPNTKVNVIVQNPTSKDNIILNEYLTRGTVRYPESALLGTGNVLIFGHSSNWAVVQNTAYKALNGIETLKRGDLIYVDSTTSRYVYSVQTVSLVNASLEYIDFSNDKNMLTLSTCNTFGKKEQRYVVEALFDRKENL